MLSNLATKGGNRRKGEIAVIFGDIARRPDSGMNPPRASDGPVPVDISILTSGCFPFLEQWEVRDGSVLGNRVTSTAIGGSYCYGHKVIFVDKESFVQLYFDNLRIQTLNSIRASLFMHRCSTRGASRWASHARRPELCLLPPVYRAL